MNEENNNYGNNQEPQFIKAPEPQQSYGGYDGGMPYYDSGKGQGKGLGIASMVCGILALVTCCLWCTCIPLAVVSIVLGIIQCVKNESKGMAIAGIVCSAVALVIFIVLTIYGTYLESTPMYQEYMEQYLNALENL